LPSIGHLFLGGMIGWFLYLISGKRFTKYHAFILMYNSYMGPDAGWVIGLGGYTHTVVGYVFFAIFLAGMYSYFTRFSVDFKKKELIDLGTPRVPYLNTFFIATAGGIMHNYLDGLMNYGGNFKLFPNITASINNFRQFWDVSPFDVNAALALILGMGLVTGYMYLYVYSLQVSEPHFLRNIILYVLGFMVLFYIFGSLTTLHADGGALVYVTIFWVIPIGLCTLSVEYNPKKQPKSDEVLQKNRVNIRKTLKKLNILFGGLMILVGIALLFLKDTLTPIVVGLWEFFIPYEVEIGMLLIYLGLVLLFIGIYNIVLAWYYSTRDTNVNVMIVVDIMFFVGIFGMILLGATTFAGGAIVDWVFAEYSMGTFITPEQLLMVARILGIIVAAIGSLNFILGIGLLWGKKKMHRFVFLYSVALAWTVLSLYIACLLSENEVKNKFR
jgi:hypothetical protein